MVDALEIEVIGVHGLDLDAEARRRSGIVIVRHVRNAGEQGETGDYRQGAAGKDRRLDDRAGFRRRRERALEDDTLGVYRTAMFGMVITECGVERLDRGKRSLLGSALGMRLTDGGNGDQGSSAVQQEPALRSPKRSYRKLEHGVAPLCSNDEVAEVGSLIRGAFRPKDEHPASTHLTVSRCCQPSAYPLDLRRAD